MASETSSATPSPVLTLVGIGSLYVAQSVIGGITRTGLPAILRENGVPAANEKAATTSGLLSR